MEKENQVRTNEQRLAISSKGDELVLGYFKPDAENANMPQKMHYKTYIAIDNGVFRKAKILKDAKSNGNQLRLKVDSQNMSKEQVLAEWNKLGEETVPFWNRKKFISHEVNELVNGKTLQNYHEVCKNYNPKKRIADMQLICAAALQSITPNTEVNYYKHKNGKWAGVDSYICIGNYEFLPLERRNMNVGGTKERFVMANTKKKMTVWDIVNTLPKHENELSPTNDIKIRYKWNKYREDEVETLKRGDLVNETEIEDRRKRYLTSNHYFVPQAEKSEDENKKVFLECWVDKETGEKLLYMQKVELDQNRIEKYQNADRIKRVEEIPGLEQKKEEVKTVTVPKRANNGMSR